MKRCLLHFLIFIISLCSVELHTQGSPTIDYWQDAALDVGLALFTQIMELDGGEALVLGGTAALAYWAGYDMFCIKLSFSNSTYSTIRAAPSDFKVTAYQGGQSYSLDFFLIYRDGEIQHWSSVRMSPGSSVELHGYFFAPQEFVGRY